MSQSEHLYLDHNASAPMPAPVREAVAWAMAELPGNPHSPHRPGRDAAAAVERARNQVAALVDRPPRQVHFTSGATEANAWVMAGMAGAGAGQGRRRLLASAVEHDSVLSWATDRLPVDGRGVLRVEALEALLQAHGAEVALVSVMAANNETGVLQPLCDVAACCRRAGVPLHVDATQVPGRIGMDLPGDLLTLSAHKLGGPKGVGCLVAATPPPPLLRGGPQERGARPGTVPVPLVVGFGLAASLCGCMDPGPRDRLEASCRPLGGRILGEGAPRLPNTLALLFPEPGDLLVMALDLEGVAASTGAACASGAAEESHVLRAMGLHGLPLRFSLGPLDQAPAVDRAAAALARVLARMRDLPPLAEARP